jgi:hypothetical protein
LRRCPSDGLLAQNEIYGALHQKFEL